MGSEYNLSKRDLRIAEALEVAPVECQSTVTDVAPVEGHNCNADSIEVADITPELQAMVTMAYEAYEQAKSFAESADDMLDEKSKVSAQAAAASQLNSAINAMSKVASLKLRIIQFKKDQKSDDEDEGQVRMSHDELLNMLKQVSNNE